MPSAPVEPSASVPALTLVPPVKVFVPLSVKVPAPAFVNRACARQRRADGGGDAGRDGDR